MTLHTQYNPITIEAALRAVKPTPPFPPIAERSAWHAVRQHLGAEGLAEALARAERDAQTPAPPLPATLWLDFARTGQRTNYEEPASLRRRMLWNLTLAECLENQGRFLDPLLNVAWAVCEESSWAYPAHEAELTDVTYPYLDLGVAGTALTLAEMDSLVGGVLDPALGTRIRAEVNRRCFTPYLTRHDHWWLFQARERNAANWTAVCNSGIVGAALYLEPDPARLADMIARAVLSLEDYLATFDRDGGSSEGPGYWGYGFGHYVMLAHLLAQRSGGQIDLLAGERLRQIASFPRRVLLSPGVYVNFADCDADVALEPALLHYLAERLALPGLHGVAAAQAAESPHRAYFDWGLRSLFWLPPPDATATYAPAPHDWFSGLQWMLARVNPSDADGLVLAAKGGHNDEMHNQNDVGAFIVHWRGESLIADAGRGRYTKAYFGEQRYEFFVNSSFGHSVPVVHAQLQAAGAQYAAQLLAHEADADCDALLLELRDAYPAAAGLQSLRRRLTLHRDGVAMAGEAAPYGWVEVQDAFEFREGPASFESALITFNKVTMGENAVLINGLRGELRVGYDPDVVVARLEQHEDIEFDNGPQTVYRIVFCPRENVQQGTVRLELVPV